MVNLRIIFLLVLILAGTVARGETNDSTAIELQEIEVKGAREEHKGDHIVLYLSKDNRSFGTNALDAVSSLSRFSPEINETELYSYNRKKVYILINGVPSQGIDLRSFKGDDIKYVEYYDVTPGRYLAFTDGPVANIVLKRKHDQYYSAYINANNAVTSGFGDNQVTASFRDSLNMISVNFYNSYRNTGDIENFAEYCYPSGITTRYSGKDSRISGHYEQLRGTYQRYQGKHLFNTTVTYLYNPGHEKYPRDISLKTKDETVHGTSLRDLRSLTSHVNVDIYYSYFFSNQRQLSVNLVNNFGNSHSTNMIEQRMGGSYVGMDATMENRLKSRNYNMIGSVTYITRFLDAYFDVSATVSHLRSRQIFAESRETPKMTTGFALFDLMWNKNNKTLIASGGMKLIAENSGFYKKTSYSPYFRLYTDWWPTGKLKGSSVQFTSTLDTSTPSIGQLVESETNLDMDYIATGNSYLKPSPTLSNRLVIGKFQGKYTGNAQLYWSYGHNAIANVLSVDGNTVYRFPMNVNHFQKYGVNFYFRFEVLPWLSLSPYVEYMHTYIPTPNQRVSYDNWRFGGSVTFHKGDWQAVLATNSPVKSWLGDIFTRSSAQYSAKVQWSHNSWSVSAGWNYLSQKELSEASIPGFSYTNRQDYKPLNHLIRLGVTWSFSKGRARWHASKAIQNEGGDSGLRSDSKAKFE